MKNVVLLAIVLLCVTRSFSQDVSPADDVMKTRTTLGLGLGMDYGGLGAQLNFQINPKVELFGALGYNFDGAGFNAGGRLRLAPSKRVVPTLSAMYGYNAVIVVKGMEELNKTYYGPSFGGGIEINSRNNDNFWMIELWLPIRSSEFKDDFDAIDNNPNIKINSLPPVAFSIAYHFTL